MKHRYADHNTQGTNNSFNHFTARNVAHNKKGRATEVIRPIVAW